MIIQPPPTDPKPQSQQIQSYRFKRGSKLADMDPVLPHTPVPPLSSFNGPFQLAEYLAHKVRHEPHQIKALVEVPTDNGKAADRHVWIYEHLRRIPIDVTPLITQLLTICSRESCPDMKADEWQYLCVAHGGEGTDRCCAIDYILHALDSTTALLNSSNYFPSRLQIPHASLSQFPSLFRRLSRIFSHAYFHHPEAFATAEAETSLYRRFVALCQRYELVGASLLNIPKSGYDNLGVDEDSDEDDSHHDEHDEDDDDDIEEHDEEDEHDLDNGPHDSEETDGDDSRQPRSREPEEPAAQRSHSLGRHPTPGLLSPTKWSVSSPVQPETKAKPAPPQTSGAHSPPSGSSPLPPSNGQVDETEVSPTAAPSTTVMTAGRNTLSRGKAPRAATVWTSSSTGTSPSKVSSPLMDMATSPNSESLLASAGAAAAARRESIDSVVFVGPEEPAQEDPVEPAENPAEKVIERRVSPVRAPSPTKSSSPGKTGGPLRRAMSPVPSADGEGKTLFTQLMSGVPLKASSPSPPIGVSPPKATPSPPQLDTASIPKVESVGVSTLGSSTSSESTPVAPSQPAPIADESSEMTSVPAVHDGSPAAALATLESGPSPAAAPAEEVLAPLNPLTSSLLGSTKPRSRPGSDEAAAAVAAAMASPLQLTAPLPNQLASAVLTDPSAEPDALATSPVNAATSPLSKSTLLRPDGTPATARSVTPSGNGGKNRNRNKGGRRSPGKSQKGKTLPRPRTDDGKPPGSAAAADIGKGSSS